MDRADSNKHQYIGDGVYAEFDGYGIWLRTGDHRDGFCDNKIYLEPEILSSLNNFYASQFPEKKEEQENATV